MNGLLIIDKPQGWTSFDVVAKIRGQFAREIGIPSRKLKVGHTGTLDPMATGVLVLCVGKATKQVPALTGLDKEYVAEVTLGATSNTDDAEGEVVPTPGAASVTESAIKDALKKFTGIFDQIPPDFSAKKVDGQKAYHAARKGKPLELKAKTITIHAIDVLSYAWPKLSLRVHCGSGTYIRALARDLGRELKTGGYLTALRRTKVGPFEIGRAKQISEISSHDIVEYLAPSHAQSDHLSE